VHLLDRLGWRRAQQVLVSLDGDLILAALRRCVAARTLRVLIGRFRVFAPQKAVE
jgi:hypothetical protein